MPSPDTFQMTVLFPLTVDTDLSLTAQSLLRRECGAQSRSIRLQPIPEKHEACLWVTLSASAYEPAVHALVLGLPAAQFGAVAMAA